jgi:hypothetical protein
MGYRTCSECRIHKREKQCLWVNTRNMGMIGRCVSDSNWGGACATCSKGVGYNPNPKLNLCKGCLANSRRGYPGNYFRGWTKKK